MNGIAHTIPDKERIDYHRTTAMLTVSYPLHATHPYERVGKEMIQAIYSLTEYGIDYGSTPDEDRVVTYRRRR